MSTPPAAALPSEILFSYLKSPHFRVLHTDGAVVSIGAQATIHMALFSERAAIPEQTVHEVTADGRVGEEIAARRVSRGGVVREVDVDIVLSFESALAVRDLLNRQIEALQNLRDANK